jgi:ABC-type enterochelin transport system ATPase subunit
MKNERNKQVKKIKQERETQTKKQAKSKQKEKGKQANQEANKQTLPHILGFGRYPLSHKPSRPSSKREKNVK